MGSISTLHSCFKAGNNQHHLPKKRSHPPSLPLPLHSCPQTALISAVTRTVKQNKASIQVKHQLFLFWEVSFSIQHVSELDHYANVCISSRRKMAEGQKQTARAWKGQNHFFQRQYECLAVWSESETPLPKRQERNQHTYGHLINSDENLLITTTKIP